MGLNYASHFSVNVFMQTSSEHLKLFKEGIHRAKLIREDLKESLIDQNFNKIKGLNKAYVDMVKEIIRQGEFFLDKSNDFKLGLRVAITIENFKAFLSAIRHKKKDDHQK